MLPDILVNRLFMRVEPTDSSYMPSLIMLSGGESIHTLKEIRTVNIGSSDSLITLLQDCTDVSKIVNRFINVAIADFIVDFCIFVL